MPVRAITIPPAGAVEPRTISKEAKPMSKDLSDDLWRLILRHRFGEEECKDHFIEKCACGAPHAEELDEENWNRVAHSFQWADHIREVLAVELPPILEDERGAP
jgi:hypothetical protein